MAPCYWCSSALRRGGVRRWCVAGIYRKIILGAFQHCFLQARPFGDSTESSLGLPGIGGVQRTESLLQSLVRTSIDAVKALQLLKTLFKMACDSIPDYDSARQIAWAFGSSITKACRDSQRAIPTIEHVLVEPRSGSVVESAAGPKSRSPIESSLLRFGLLSTGRL